MGPCLVVFGQVSIEVLLHLDDTGEGRGLALPIGNLGMALGSWDGLGNLLDHARGAHDPAGVGLREPSRLAACVRFILGIQGSASGRIALAATAIDNAWGSFFMMHFPQASLFLLL